MIKTRLIGLVPDSKKYIAANVLMQWIGLCSNAFMIITIARMLESLRVGIVPEMAAAGITIVLCALVRVICVKLAASASFYASRSVKRTLRGEIYQKADEYSYGSLPGIVFARTEALGCGGKCCDFHIYKENAK